jgi:ribosomal protein L11 methyltransferase
LRESCEEVEARDWLAEWRRLARPIPVGRRFLLDPREPEEELRDDDIGDDVGEDAADRLVLLLPARNAFGTGSHESTRLAIELLEAAPLAGATVLDVGTGTGVLAFAALALGARSVVGFDVDPASAVQARLNVALNAAVLGEGASRFAPFAGTGAAIAPTARFDLLLINVLPGRILDQLAPLVATLRPGGALLFSGIVAEQVSTVKSRCGELGLADTAEQRDGEWVAFRFERAGGEVRR